MKNSKFVIQPHFRLQEWVAEEKGYFKDEGLDYVFQETVQTTDGKAHDQATRGGAMQTFEKGRTSDISCACHWTVDVAASKGHGKLYSDVYSVSPAGIFVPPNSPIKIAGSNSPAFRFRSAISRAATTRPSRRSNNICRPTRSTCRSSTACCSTAWNCWSTARCRRRRCSADRITSPSSSASARSSTRRS